MLDALILDYGGVLIHEDPADYDALCRPHGFADGDVWTLVHSIPEYRPSRIGEISGEEFQLAVRGHMARIAGERSADAAIGEILADYQAHAEPRPIMRELLIRLRPRTKLVLLSNGTRGATARLEQRGLLDIVDAIVCSGDVGVAKPDAAAYRLAAQRAGAALERCAFVDDVAANVAAAHALGIRAVRYHHAHHEQFLDALKSWALLD